MKIKIRVKGVSNRKNQIGQMVCDYELPCRTLREFLTETVRMTVRTYNRRISETKNSSRDFYDRSEDENALLTCLTAQQMEDLAQTGKVSFGVLYNAHGQDEAQAVQTALSCFEDGMIAVFINGTRIEQLEQEIAWQGDDEVTFVRLTFLAGRMW